MKSKVSSLISTGNRKLSKEIAIFNMSSATDCPSKKKGLCKAASCGAKCYAMKAEQAYPAALPYRRRQEQLWKNITSEQFSNGLAELNANKKVKISALRLNEAGDFHTQACVDKAECIAIRLAAEGITTYAYTSRNDLDFSGCKRLIINGSGFKTKGVANVFKIVDNISQLPKGYSLCGGSCGKGVCTRCMSRGMKTAVLKH